ncbi:MAG: sulfotransferase family 2 domain-containing protein [Ignavibacteria bacterium]|jgi:hypothetical protein
MIYFPKHRLLFTHISRTGGSTIRNYLLESLPDANEILGQHEPLASAIPILSREFYRAYKFAFVRNPWERFVSWYALIGQSTGKLIADPVSEHWKGFDGFLESWSSEMILIDGVSRPKHSQWALLSDADGKLLTDDIGRFESFEEDVLRIFKKIGINCSSLPKVNTSRHLHYSCYYSDFGRELISNVFNDDVENFGYEFESISIT